MTRQANSTVASARPRRSALARRNRLDVKNKEPGYVYRIVNDVDDNILERQEQGYEIVPKEKIGRVGDARVDNPTALGTSSYLSVGQGIKAVVMRQRDEFYKEDQAIKQQAVDDTEQTMHLDKADYGTIKRGVKVVEPE